MSRRIISPVARVTVNKTIVWQSGDGILKSVSVELGENQRSSRCSIQVYDPDLLIGAAFQKMSLSTGGILTPEGLLQQKESSPAVSSTPTNPTLPGAAGSGGSARNTSLSNEERAFLDIIAYSEGTAGHGDDGYNVIVDYKYFKDYSKHPNVYVRRADSTAAGRYQFINKTWWGLQKKLKLKDFSPISQDIAAIELVKEAGALPDVNRGSAGLEAALYKCRSIWASFPASPHNQPRRQLSELKNKYISFLLKYQRR